MLVYVTRDSVAAGDDIDAPHAQRFEVPEEWAWKELAKHVTEHTEFASIAGGQATWALTSNVPIAVYAQQWARSKVLYLLDSDRERLDWNGRELRLHWSYFAQTSPDVVYDVLRRLRLKA